MTTEIKKTKLEKLTEEISELEAKRDELVRRLDDGASKIEQAQAQRKDTSEWEDYWIGLLRHYEAVCDKLRELNLGLKYEQEQAAKPKPAN